MTDRRLWLAFLLAGIPGIASAETVTFDPPEGSERTYHMELSMRLGNRNDPGYYFDTRSISALTRLVATGRNADGQRSLEIFPLWTAFDSGASVISSALGDISREMAETMREGFTASVDRDKGKLVDFARRDGGEMSGDLVGQMREQLHQPLPPVAIEAEPGWSTETALTALIDVDITVTKVTSEDVFIRYDGESEFMKLSGLSVLDRETGWVERSVLTYEATLDLDGEDGDHLRQTIAMAPADYPYAVNADYARNKPEWYPMPEGPLPPAEPLPSEDQIFAHPFGQAEEADDAMRLTFGHSAAIGYNIGRFSIHDMRLFDGKRPLDTELFASEPVALPGYRGDQSFLTLMKARPVGIGDAREDLVRASEVRADVDWYSASPFAMTLHPDTQGNATVSRNGATATFRPNEDGYELVLTGEQDDYFQWSFPKGSDVKGRIYAGDRGADWLTPTESQARRLAAPDHSALRIALQSDTMPEEVRIRVNRTADQPTATRQIVFLTKRGERLNPDSEPKRQLLFRDGAPVALDAVAPEGVEQAALRFRLPVLQADQCHARLAEPAPLAGHALKFAQKTPDGSGYQGTRLLELQTEDGIRSHFYDHGTVEVALDCDATVIWQDAGVEPDADRPWQVDPDALAIDPEMTIAAFNDRFRIVDSEGAALAFVSPDSGRLWMDDTISDALFDEGYLRMAGRPARILKAVVDEKPVTRRFTVTFPELPAPIPAPEQKEDAR